MVTLTEIGSLNKPSMMLCLSIETFVKTTSQWRPIPQAGTRGYLLLLTGAGADGGITMKTRMIGYWATTTLIALELLVGGAADLVHGRALLFVGDPVVEVIAHLGYPVYVLTILGWWKLLGAIVLLAPCLPRLKEWAYAGTFFDLTGAALSFALRGDSADAIAPLFLAMLAVASWALRPPGRTLGVLFPARGENRKESSYSKEHVKPPLGRRLSLP
jgi:hypothetical protein